VAAVCDSDPRRAALLGAAYGAPVVPTYSDVLARSDIDLVVILTLDHEEAIEDAIRAGKHVFTEKPVSLIADASARLGALAAGAGLLLEVGVMRAYDPVFERIRDIGGSLSPRVCSMRKLDGLDAIARRRVLPDAVTAYSFDVSGNDHVAPLSTQETALRLLLWSGYHLLTALSMLVDEPRILGVHLAEAGDQLLAVLSNDRAEPFAVTIGDLPGPLYDDAMSVALDGGVVTVAFDPPYGGGATRLAGHRFGAGRARVESWVETGFGNPVGCLWADIAGRLDEGWSEPTPTFRRAMRVERLAARIARNAEVSGGRA
jgi:hypothetical protein